MYLKSFVYVSSVNNLSDARYCSGMFVDYIGFNFDQNSKNKISIDNFKEIKNWINGPKIVAEFADSSITYIEEFMSKIEVDYLSINYSSEIIKKIDKNCIVNISDKNIIQNVTEKINVIYKQIKKNEIKPDTDYLFNNSFTNNNLEKTIAKLDKMNSISGMVPRNN